MVSTTWATGSAFDRDEVVPVTTSEPSAPTVTIASSQSSRTRATASSRVATW